jgi:acetyltransferase-like isoleucine patch superfamily enzyme
MGILKIIGHLLGLLRALPHVVECLLLHAAMGQPRAFSMASERIARLPGVLGIYARQWFYRVFLSSVGEDVHFGFMSLLSKPETAIGERVYIGRFCCIGWANIGDQAILADGVQVLSGRHQHGKEAVEGHPIHDNPLEFSRICIGKGAWIGAGAIIMADVGAGAVVGAGSVVVRPVGDGERVAGVPARPITSRSQPKAA